MPIHWHDSRSMRAPLPNRWVIWRSLTVDEMKRAADDMTEVEIDRARAQMKAGLLMGLESPSNRAERLCADVADLGPRAGAG